MNDPTPQPPTNPVPLISMGDLYYVLFRHKWKILMCTLAGVAAAAAYYKLSPPPFKSEADLFVRYIVTAGKATGPAGDQGTVKTPDQGGESIMESEVQILQSLDLAKQVAEAVGPEKILVRLGGGDSPDKAAFALKRNLTVEALPKTSVIRIDFRHPDPAIVQPVLAELIDLYLKKHVEIHRAVGIVGEFLTQETDQLRASLAQTEDDLRRAKDKVGIISLDDAKKTYSDQIAHIEQQIFDNQTELAERMSDNGGAGILAAASASPAAPDTPAIPQDKIDAFRDIEVRLDLLKRSEQEMMTQFTDANPRLQGVRARIGEADDGRKKLLEQYPGLVRIGVPSITPAASPAGGARESQLPSLEALQAKAKVLASQLKEVRAEEADLDQMEGTISELQRRKELEEQNYRYYSASLEQSRINEALGAGNASDITAIQRPSPPVSDTAKFNKVLAGILMAGFGIGIAWAFLIELYFDRSVRRIADVERIPGLPLFLSIPMISDRKRQAALSLPSAAGKNGGSTEVGPWNGADPLHPFHETLRDRLISYFESKNLTHKPKLVAVTGLGRRAGVTTTAAGLAGTLSETGDGNVLLVDMTMGQGSAQQFYKGKAVCGLEELLDTRDSAQIQGHLYVVGEGQRGDKLSKILPQRFNKLVPKLKASDFDYIIFDMPPVSQISITPRLASFMDMVLMVVESEKTDRNVLQRATALLANSNANVGAVLNKTQTYVPLSLHQETLGNI